MLKLPKRTRAPVRGIDQAISSERAGLQRTIQQHLARWMTTHKDSDIVNTPNDWCYEIGEGRYVVDLVKRIVTLSVESVKIIAGLPELTF